MIFSEFLKSDKTKNINLLENKTKKQNKIKLPIRLFKQK
jgi:hypothetical protein